MTEVRNALGQVSVERVLDGNALNRMNRLESFLNPDQVNLSAQENPSLLDFLR